MGMGHGQWGAKKKSWKNEVGLKKMEKWSEIGDL